MKAVARALGIDPERLTILLYQLVKLLRDGKEPRWGSARRPTSRSAKRWTKSGRTRCASSWVARSADATMEFDLDLAKKQEKDNPVYYVQYAHARCSRVLSVGSGWPAGRRLQPVATSVGAGADPQDAASSRRSSRRPFSQLAPHHLPYYAQDLAKALTTFYDNDACKVLSDDEPLKQARLALVAACQRVLANTLKLIGVSAPEQM